MKFFRFHFQKIKKIKDSKKFKNQKISKMQGIRYCTQNRCANIACYGETRRQNPDKCPKHRGKDYVMSILGKCRKIECRNLASFAKDRKSKPYFCHTHKNDTYKIKIWLCKGSNGRCLERPIYGRTEFSKPIRCVKHNKIGLSQSTSKLCIIDECRRPISQKIPRFCGDHKYSLECAYGSCTKQSLYGYDKIDGKRNHIRKVRMLEFCKDHQPVKPISSDFTPGTCKIYKCENTAIFSKYSFTEEKFCILHVPEGYVKKTLFRTHRKSKYDEYISNCRLLKPPKQMFKKGYYENDIFEIGDVDLRCHEKFEDEKLGCERTVNSPIESVSDMSGNESSSDDSILNLSYDSISDDSISSISCDGSPDVDIRLEEENSHLSNIFDKTSSDNFDSSMLETMEMYPCRNSEYDHNFFNEFMKVGNENKDLSEYPIFPNDCFE